MYEYDLKLVFIMIIVKYVIIENVKIVGNVRADIDLSEGEIDLSFILSLAIVSFEFMVLLLVKRPKDKVDI